MDACEQSALGNERLHGMVRDDDVVFTTGTRGSFDLLLDKAQ